VAARLAIAAALIVVVAVAAWFLRRRPPAPPPRDVYPVPRQLDRADFPRPDASWLVVLFSSAVCLSCRELPGKIAVLESADVATCDISLEARRDLHDRYALAAIPTTVIADHEGVVRKAFVGAYSATDLWAAVAELRVPGSTPEPSIGDLDLGLG
jgi:hypothetical protein